MHSESGVYDDDVLQLFYGGGIQALVNDWRFLSRALNRHFQVGVFKVWIRLSLRKLLWSAFVSTIRQAQIFPSFPKFILVF